MLLHQIWMGNPLPPHLKKFMESSRQHCKGDWKLWTEEEIAKLPTFGRIAPYVLPRSFGSDMARAEIIWRYGGWYVDTDVEILQQLPNQFPILLTKESNDKLSGCLMYGEQGHTFFETYITWLQKFLAEIKEGQPTTSYTGRGMLYELATTLGQQPNIIGQRITPIKWKPFWLLQANWNMQQPTLAIHHPQLSWQGEGYKKLRENYG